MNLLAFDLGGSGGKVMEGHFDGKRITLSELVRFEHSSVLMGDGLYWEIAGIYRNLLDGLRKASGPVLSLGIDSFSNDFGFIDKNGELLTPVRCYRDERTSRYADYVYGKISPRRLYELTGNQNALFSTLMQLGAMQAAGQDWILDNAYKLLFVPDLLIYFLTGEAAAEYTISSVSQLYSYSDREFSKEVLEAFNIRRDLFGPVVMPGTVTGQLRERLCREQGISPFRVVSVCEHDTASAYLSSPLDRRDAIIISSGTWSLMGCELQQPLINEAAYRHNIANEGGYPDHHRFLKNVMGSWIIQEIRAEYRFKGIEYSYAELENMAKKATPFAFFIDVDDTCFFAPGNILGKIEESCRQRYGTVPEDTGALVRCVYESLAMKYRRNLELLKEVTGISFSVINIIGGGSKDSLMCSFTANACCLPVAAGPQEATVLGNILVQLIAAGKITSIKEGRNIIVDSFPTQVYEPEDTSRWKEGYDRYCALFPVK
ncbi:MAG: rhamnulokinase [Treponema sp.]|nr:rhamnulokinase [Treponema sp.]